MEIEQSVTGNNLPQSPWKLSPPIEVCSLSEVMDEELARSLQSEDKFRKGKTLKSNDFTLPSAAEFEDEDSDCKNDLILAEMLQAEFDLEHDELLKREEKKFNGSSKVTVSFKNFRKVPDCVLSDDDSESDVEEPTDWDSFENERNPVIGRSGFSQTNSQITTKHDANVCGRRNACKIMEFPPGVETGDGGAHGFNMKLSNKVYNVLKVHSMSEEKRSKRLHDKIEKATALEALDPNTRLILYKMVNAGILEGINGSLSTGKEAVVFHAIGGQSPDITVPGECAIKVYKTTLNEFKTRDKYIQDDFRFRDRINKQNARKYIKVWAEKEMHNLRRMMKVGIPCPEVVTLKKNVLVMSFIGHDLQPAPQLKNATLTRGQLETAYKETVQNMKRMYVECKLVHADLSEYNILWHDDHVWFIDVSQSVELSHPMALEFLKRDCENISTFFLKQGVKSVRDSDELFSYICERTLPGEGAGLLSQIDNYEKNEELITHGMSEKPYPFESMFDRNMPMPGNERIAEDDGEKHIGSADVGSVL